MLRVRHCLPAICLTLACFAATCCLAQPPAPSPARPAADRRSEEMETLRTQVEAQQRALDEQAARIERLTGRVEAFEQAPMAAISASEDSARNATLVIETIKWLGTLVAIALAALAFFGYRTFHGLILRLRERVAASQKAAEDAGACASEAERHLEQMQEIARKASEMRLSAESELQKLQEPVRQLLQRVDVTKEVSQADKSELDEVSRKLELLEVLGLPLDAEAYFVRGNEYYVRGDYEHAFQCYNRAIEIKPDYAEAHCARAVALARLGRYERVLAALDRAIEIEPDLAVAHTGKGGALSSLGRHEEALAEFDRAIEINPDEATAYFNRACAHARLNNRDAALGDLKRAIEMDAKYREMARTDPDFESLRDDPEFRKLVGLDGEESV